jgi:hypothetical protein
MKKEIAGQARPVGEAPRSSRARKETDTRVHIRETTLLKAKAKKQFQPVQYRTEQKNRVWAHEWSLCCAFPFRKGLSACRSARVIVKAASEYKIWKAPPRARPRYHHLLTSQLPTPPTPLFIVTRNISPESPASVLLPHTTTTSCLPRRLPPLPRKRPRRRPALLSMPATLVSFHLVATQQCWPGDNSIAMYVH